jgi:mannose-6-phosphate isomerase-like protein (cupin superfamily)
MAVKNQILDMTPLGMHFTVLNSSTDTAGKSLELHWKLSAKCNMEKPLVHIHPNAIETYEVLEGEMEFFIADEWVAAKKGDKFTVKKGIKHAFRNPTGQVVQVFNTHQPALKMEGYFEAVCQVLDVLTEQRSKALKMNLKGMIHFSALMNQFREEIISVDPPDIAVRVLGYIAKLKGVAYGTG